MVESRRILVTGGSGFLGRHTVLPLLRRNADVIVTGRRQCSGGLGENIRFLELDLLRCADIDRPIQSAAADTLIHLAWETRHGYFWQAPENLDWIAASLRVVKAFAAAGGRRVVCAGTCVEYRAPPTGPCIPGITPIAPLQLYGVAKDAFHRALAAYASTCGMTYAWGRVFFLTGPGEAPARLVPSAIRTLAAGEPFASGSGDRVRDFMDVRDCGAAFAALALGDVEGAVNISSGRPTTIEELLRMVAGIMGRQDLVAFGKLPDRTDEPANLWGDTNTLHRVVGFAPSFSLRDSLKAAVACWEQAQPAHY